MSARFTKKWQHSLTICLGILTSLSATIGWIKHRMWTQICSPESTLPGTFLNGMVFLSN